MALARTSAHTPVGNKAAPRGGGDAGLGGGDGGGFSGDGGVGGRGFGGE